MGTLKIVLMVVFVIICLAISVIILLQEGKSAGLGAITGQSSETYWSKNKNKSREGFLIKATTTLVVLFFVIALVLNLNIYG